MSLLTKRDNTAAGVRGMAPARLADAGGAGHVHAAVRGSPHPR